MKPAIQKHLSKLGTVGGFQEYYPRSSLIKESLRRVEELCEDFNFLHRINRWTIINYHAIKRIETDKERRLLLVILKEGLTDNKHDNIEKYYSVNRNNAKTFRKWMESQQQKDK